jgi:putative hemolysin
MRDLPLPTAGFAKIEEAIAFPKLDFRRSLQPRQPQALVVQETADERTLAATEVEAFWASNLAHVRQAQRLRYTVFADEMGARLPEVVEGHDVDRFDDYCEHLLVRHKPTGDIVGTYRVLTPAQAKRAGGLYTETEFDASALQDLRSDLVELGRSCVHAEFRSGAVIMALWTALAQFMQRNRLQYMVGCASIPMQQSGVAPGLGVDLAASVWMQLKDRYMAAEHRRVHARLPLPMDERGVQVQAEPPALIKAYLRLGARILGAPSWDPDFNTADLPLLMCLQDMPSRYRKHFLGA